MTALTLIGASDGDWGHPWWPLWLILWAALAGLVAWLIVRRGNRRPDPHDRARELLAERFARGELNATEYRERLETLTRAEAR